MMHFKLFFIVTAFMFVMLGKTYATDFSGLSIVTEDFPPFNHNKNGKVEGTAVDLLLAASKAAGAPIDRKQIKLLTWARGYKMVQDGPNVMLFSTTRTEERENLFKWAGPIGQNRVVVWAKKSSGIGQIADITQVKEKVAVVRDDVGDQLAVAAGVPENIIDRKPKPEGTAKMLANGRIKLWAYGEIGGINSLKRVGENPDDYEVVYVLDAKDLYFAFSKDVDDGIINLLQKGIDMTR